MSQEGIWLINGGPGQARRSRNVTLWLHAERDRAAIHREDTRLSFSFDNSLVTVNDTL